MADPEDIDGLLDLCDTLNVFSVSGRYPGDLMQVSIFIARDYFESASRVREELLKQIRP